MPGLAAEPHQVFSPCDSVPQLGRVRLSVRNPASRHGRSPDYCAIWSLARQVCNALPITTSCSPRRLQMKVGVPKEIKTHEYRVGLTPGAVREYVAAGHSVLLETNAGAGIGATDDDYRKAGATIASSAREVFASSEMIVKVQAPLP